VSDNQNSGLGPFCLSPRGGERSLNSFCHYGRASSLLLVLDNLAGDSVHVGDTSLGEGLAVDHGSTVGVLEGHLANELGLLELLEAVSDALASGKSGVLGDGASSLGGRVVLSQGVDTDLSSHVQLVGDGGGSDVKPVGIIGGEVLEAAGLVVRSPLLLIINFN